MFLLHKDDMQEFLVDAAQGELSNFCGLLVKALAISLPLFVWLQKWPFSFNLIFIIIKKYGKILTEILNFQKSALEDDLDDLESDDDIDIRVSFEISSCDSI